MRLLEVSISFLQHKDALTSRVYLWGCDIKTLGYGYCGVEKIGVVIRLVFIVVQANLILLLISA